MKAARLPDDENMRMDSLKKLQLLDTPIEQRFERITRLLCQSLNVPMAAFTLVDKDRQWFKSTQGFNSHETPRQLAFCAHAILEEDVMLVPDATRDDRFHDNPLVTGDMGINFYAGCSVRSPDGNRVGTLCAIDTKPRELSSEATQMLRDLSALLETELQAMSLSKIQTDLLAELDASQRLALIDPLTRLWNRNGILSFLKRRWSEALRTKSAVSVVMADIDHFKKVNDTYGHPAGDSVLQAVAQRMQSALRTEDAIGRFGGEEFLMVLSDTKHASLKQTVERIRQSVKGSAVTIAKGKLFATSSFGATSVTANAKLSPETLIALADEALYRAKNAGRDCVEIA